ncbi:MFS transporter, partial [Streptomyces sp. NPDC005122]
IFLLMFALPKRPAQHVEGAEEEPVGGDSAGEESPSAGQGGVRDDARSPEDAAVSDGGPVLTG